MRKRDAVARDVGRGETGEQTAMFLNPSSCVFLSELSGKHDSVFTMNFSSVFDDDRRDLAGSLTSPRRQPYPSPIR